MFSRRCVLFRRINPITVIPGLSVYPGGGSGDGKKYITNHNIKIDRGGRKKKHKKKNNINKKKYGSSAHRLLFRTLIVNGEKEKKLNRDRKLTAITPVMPAYTVNYLRFFYFFLNLSFEWLV